MSTSNLSESTTSERKKSSIKPAVIVVALALGAGLGVLGAVLFGSNGSSSVTTATESPAQPNTIPVSKPALGVPIPTFKSTGDVREYVKAVLNAPKPTDYQFPDYFATVSYDEAVHMVNVHYPQFENKEGEELMNAVYENPALYQEMMREATAVRDYYHPGWREQRLPH